MSDYRYGKYPNWQLSRSIIYIFETKSDITKRFNDKTHYITYTETKKLRDPWLAKGHRSNYANFNLPYLRFKLIFFNAIKSDSFGI